MAALRGESTTVPPYWKTSKVMADGVSAHIKDSIIGRVSGEGFPHIGEGHIWPFGRLHFFLDNVTL